MWHVTHSFANNIVFVVVNIALTFTAFHSLQGSLSESRGEQWKQNIIESKTIHLCGTGDTLFLVCDVIRAQTDCSKTLSLVLVGSVFTNWRFIFVNVFIWCCREPEKVEVVRCDATHVCLTGQTCCKLSSGQWGCCPLPQVRGHSITSSV